MSDTISIYKGDNHRECDIDEAKKSFAQYLQTENLNFLIGCGCSSNVEDGKELAIPIMNGLYKSFFEGNLDFDIAGIDPKDKFDNNLESMLDTMLSIKMTNYLVKTDERIDEKIKAVQKHIVDKIINGQNCKSVLDYYKSFYLKLVQPSRRQPINIFTTNYDLFNEQALDSLGFYYNNGFSGSCIRKFNPNVYNYVYVENMNLHKDVWGRVSSFFNLYKIHGSINWVVENNEVFEKPVDSCVEERVLIYPTPQKDRSTLMTPYSDLMRNMQQELVKNNSVLVTLGYSFSDDHINRIILNSLSNPSFKLIVLGSGTNIKKLIELNDKRIIVINSDNKIHYFKNFVKELMPDIEESIQEEMELTNGVAAIKEFESLSEDK